MYMGDLSLKQTKRCSCKNVLLADVSLNYDNAQQLNRLSTYLIIRILRNILRFVVVDTMYK